MTDFQHSAEPKKYRVTFVDVRGNEKVVRIITNRGPLKAVYMAARPIGFFRRDAFEVRVADDGELDYDENGVVRLDGYSIDRNEW